MLCVQKSILSIDNILKIIMHASKCTTCGYTQNTIVFRWFLIFDFLQTINTHLVYSGYANVIIIHNVVFFLLTNTRVSYFRLELNNCLKEKETCNRGGPHLPHALADWNAHASFHPESPIFYIEHRDCFHGCPVNWNSTPRHASWYIVGH